jgi:hypothetical protein
MNWPALVWQISVHLTRDLTTMATTCASPVSIHEVRALRYDLRHSLRPIATWR